MPFSFAGEITIKKGDTLTKIANENNTTIREIMDLNNIYDANLLKEGQKLKVPKKYPQYKIHVVQKGESLTQISKIYDIRKDEIISLNKLKDPNSIYIGQRLSLPISDKISVEKDNEITQVNIPSKSNQDEVISINNEDGLQWKTYGPLKINWESWKFEDGSFISNSIHENGKPLFVAVKCSKRIINRTGVDAKWREWITPRDDFEYDLVNDLCESE